MTIPQNSKVIEYFNATVWLDEQGILCTVSKKAVQPTIDQAKETMEDLIALTDGKKVCLLSDTTDSAPANKELRDYYAVIIPRLAKAVAVISRSPVGKMAANLFFSLKKQPYPVKMFTDEYEAKEWLRQYL